MNTKQIEQIDDFTFRVPSDRNGITPYFVDALAHGGLSQCDCRDWKVRVGPHLHETGFRKSCKHIRRVVFWLGQKVIEERLRQRSEKERKWRPKNHE